MPGININTTRILIFSIKIIAQMNETTEIIFIIWGTKDNNNPITLFFLMNSIASSVHLPNLNPNAESYINSNCDGSLSIVSTQKWLTLIPKKH